MGRNHTNIKRHPERIQTVGRPLEDGQLKYLVTDMLNHPSERDNQRLVGASQIGNPCDFCLGNSMVGHGQRRNNYWMGARIGTAIHAALETEAEKHVDRPRQNQFEALRGAKIEQKIILGTIQGYGTIKSKPDLVLTEHDHLVDYKTTTKAKLAKMKASGSVPIQYVYQQQLYAWGLNNDGIKVKRISLVFIARDGSNENDIWVHSFDYDESKALAAWARLGAIWEYLEENNHDTSGLTSHHECWYCVNMLGRI